MKGVKEMKGVAITTLLVVLFSAIGLYLLHNFDFVPYLFM